MGRLAWEKPDEQGDWPFGGLEGARGAKASCGRGSWGGRAHNRGPLETEDGNAGEEESWHNADPVM